MAKYPYKTYIRLMQKKHGLIVERATRPDYSSLSIKDEEGHLIFSGFQRGAPEVAWDELWREGRWAVEQNFDEKMFDVFEEMDELKESWKKVKNK